MKHTIRLMVLSLLAVLLLPAFIAGVRGAGTTESWGVSTGQTKYFTVGTDLSLNLPDAMWPFINQSLWQTYEDLFNETEFEVGYGKYYPIGYEAGWNRMAGSGPFPDPEDEYENGANNGWQNGYWDGRNDRDQSDYAAGYHFYYPSGYDDGYYLNSYTTPYPSAYDQYEYGSDNGYEDGYWDGYDDYFNSNGYLYSYNDTYDFPANYTYLASYDNTYEGIVSWGGFPIEDEIAFNARTLFENALELPMIFNVQVNITNMEGITYPDDFGHWEYIYTPITQYFNYDAWVPSYSEPWSPYTYHPGYYAPSDGYYITGYNTLQNWVIDWTNIVSYDEINATIRMKLPTDVTYLPLENFTIHYGQYILLPFIAANFPGELKNNITAKINDGLTDMQNTIDNSSYEFIATDQTIMQWVTNVILPEDAEFSYIYEYGVEALLPIGGYPGSLSNGGPQMYVPLFVPTDTNFRPTFEKAKDLINWQLTQVHGTYLAGGFNAIVDQLGADVIVNEKEIYFGVHNLDFQYFFGAVGDLGGRFLLDMLQDFFDEEGIASIIDNESLDASAIMAMRWNTEGVMQNLHTEFSVGAKYDVLNTMGVTITVDLSAGEQSILSTAYTGKPTALAPLPPETYFDWGVTEGDVKHWTTGYDFNLEMPQPVWNLMSDGLQNMIDQAFNNQYAIGYNDYYEDGYMDGFAVGSIDGSYAPTPPYPSETTDYQKGANSGYNSGYNDGYYDGYFDDPYGTDYDNQYEGVEPVNFPIGELDAVDAKALYDAIIDYIPSVMQIESEVTDMFTVAMTQYYEGEDEWVESHYDGLISTFKARLPTESVYRPVGTLATDYFEGLYDLVTEVFPGTIGANITGKLDELKSMMELPIAKGISLFDVVSQMIPAIPYVWGSTNATFVPDFAKDLGVTQDSRNIFGQMFAMPSTLYIPLTTNFETAYIDWITWMHDLDPTFDATKIGNFLHNMSVDDFEVNQREINFVWNIEGISDTFFDHMEGAAEGITNFTNMFYETFGITLDKNTLSANVAFALRYDDLGVLENAHLQAGFSIMSTASEELSLAVELDMSQGEYQAINQKFLGKPLIKVYDHWANPDADMTVTVQPGVDQFYQFLDDDGDSVLSFEVSTTSEVTLSVQAWINNPTEIDAGFATGTVPIYFAFDVEDEAAIDFPILMSVKLPDGLDSKSDTEILSLLRMYTYDEGTNTWTAESFPMTLDRENGVVIIEVTHLSVFAFGVMPITTTPTSPFNIPGFTPFFLLLASIGAVAGLLSKKKR